MKIAEVGKENGSLNVKRENNKQQKKQNKAKRATIQKFRKDCHMQNVYQQINQKIVSFFIIC